MKGIIILTAAFVAVGLIALLPIRDHTAGTVVHAEDPAPSKVLDAATLEAIKTMPWSEASRLLDPLREEARQALQSGLNADAALRFEEIARTLPTSPNTADAWLWAGIAHGRASSAAQAQAAYDNVVSVCKGFLVIDEYDPPDYRQGLPYAPSLRDMLRRAIRYKVEVCWNANDTQGAWSAIQQFRAEEPEYHYLRKLLPLQARLQGVSAEDLDGQEAVAWKLSDQAKWAKDRGESEDSLRFADQVIAQYPETGGAMLARRTKGMVLWRLKRFEEARAVFQDILNRSEAIAPICDLVREARAKIAYLDAVPQLRAVVGKCQSGARAAVTEAEWEGVWANSRIIMSDDGVPVVRASAHIMYLEALHFRGEHEKVLVEAERLKALHNRPENLSDPGYRNLILGADCYAAYGLLKLNRLQEAADRFTAVVTLYRDDQTRWSKGTCLPDAYFGLWSALRAMGASAEDAKGAVAPMLSTLPPGSYYVRTVENAR
jgi:tetratricopeptide (TPR) repeat protein